MYCLGEKYLNGLRKSFVFSKTCWSCALQLPGNLLNWRLCAFALCEMVSPILLGLLVTVKKIAMIHVPDALQAIFHDSSEMI
jgi:hypothetical protein